MPSSRKARTVFAFGLAACILELEREEKQKQRRNKYRIRPYLKKRGNVENLLQGPTLFFENFHMSELTFNALFGLVEKHLVSKRTTDPETISVPPKTQLGIVLQFLATGELRRHSGHRNHFNTQDLRSILEKVCDAICKGLQDEFPKWTTENMLKWAEEFEKKLKFPNCLGVVGGKHVAIKKPSNSDDLFLNYKGFHSVVIVAICDAFYRFTYIDVGAFGKGGDQYAFTQSKLGKDLLSDKLPFPKDSMLNDNETPYYIAGNDAFPLHLRLMKPYFGKHLDEKEQVFNSKLSDTLRCIENAFAILSARWMAFQRTLPNQPYEAQKIIATCCYLHNFLMRESPETYTITPDSEIPPNTVMTELRPCRRGRPLDYCKELRNNLKEYLNSCA